MSRHSCFDSFEDMIRASGFNLSYSYYILSSNDWDKFVVANTDYPSWAEMYEEALELYADRLCLKVDQDLDRE
ncbi:hypothetical protein ACMXYQ_15960 [Neptuniibacter sp. PT34_22]|uniref:hypothetical protein n=1 Tax=Neptuniibacter sp. PT34_22 TaxID=3398205 RepID=UPI0039F49E8A